MQSAILDDKTPHMHTLETKSLRKQDAQNGSTMSDFGRYLTDFLKSSNRGEPRDAGGGG
jgi:hypothetical protein